MTFAWTSKEGCLSITSIVSSNLQCLYKEISSSVRFGCVCLWELQYNSLKKFRRSLEIPFERIWRPNINRLLYAHSPRTADLACSSSNHERNPSPPSYGLGYFKRCGWEFTLFRSYGAVTSSLILALVFLRVRMLEWLAVYHEPSLEPVESLLVYLRVSLSLYLCEATSQSLWSVQMRAQ